MSDVFKIDNPAVLPPNTGMGIAFSSDGMYMSVAHSISPFITIYKRNGDVFTKLDDPEVLPTGNGMSTAFSSDGMYMSVAHAVSPFITIYKRDGDVFTKLPNPVVLPVGTGEGTAFSPDGVYMSVAHRTSPFITIYKRDGDVFTKLADPTVLPANTGLGTAFSPDGAYMSVAHGNAPFITIYKRDGDVFTKLDNPTVLPASTGRSTAFSPCSTYMSVAHSTSPHITIYRRHGDIFIKLDDPEGLPANAGYGTAFSPDGVHMSVAHFNSPFITIYKRDGDVFTKLDNPTILPAGDGRGVAFSPDGVYMSVGHQNSPSITIYDVSALNRVPKRIRGLLGLSANFEPKMAAPLDARNVVHLKKDLIKNSTWETDDEGTYAYKGMCTTVINDKEENNGLYVLLSEDYTEMDNWVKTRMNRIDPNYISQKDRIIVTGIQPGGWTGEGPHVKTISAPGMRPNYVPRAYILFDNLNYSQQMSALTAWEKIYKFDVGLNQATLYATELVDDTHLNVFFQVMTNKTVAPAATPIVSNITDNSAVVTGGSVVRIREVDGVWSDWQTSPHTFIGLTHETDYEAQAMQQKSLVYHESGPGEIVSFTT